MDEKVLIYAALGGLIPDALRVLKWSRQTRRSPNPLRDVRLYISVVIQVALGLLGVNLLGVSTPQQCVAVGYAGPDILVRMLSSIASTRDLRLGAAPETATGSSLTLLSWWAF